MIEGTQFGTNIGEVNVNLQGAKIASDKAKNVTIGDFVDYGKVANQAAQVSVQVMNAQGINDANTAKTDYMNIVTSAGYLDSTSTLKAEMLEEVQNSLSSKSTAYQSAYLGYAASEYSIQYGKRADETRRSYYNSTDSAKKAWEGAESTVENPMQDYSDTEAPIEYLTNKDAKKTPSDFVDWYSKQYPRLEPSVIRNALVGQLYTDMSTQIASADESTMEEVLLNVAEQKKEYENPMFLTTKQKEGAAVVAEYERNLAMTIKNKKAEFKNQAYGRLAQATQGGYRVLPDLVKKDIVKTASNPLAAEKQYQEYVKKNNERLVADEYNSTYEIGNKTGSLPDNKLLKDERQQAVTSTLYDNFVSGNFTDFVRIADNENGMTAKMGEGILTQFNKTESSEEMNMMLTSINKINEQPKGATVLRQMFSDDEYTRIMSVKYMSQARPNEPMSVIRDFVDQTAQSLVTMKLDPSANANMLEYAQDLGTQSQAYVNVMQNILKVNPKLAQAEYKNIAKTFAAQAGKDSTGLQEDTSMSSNPSLTPDIIDSNAVDAAINSVLPEGTTSKTYMPGNIVVAKDAYSGTIAIVDVSNTIKDSESATTETLIQEQEDITAGIKTSPIIGAKVAVKSFTRTILDNAGDVFVGASAVTGDLVDQFQMHLFDSMTEGQQEMFKGWKPNQDLKETSSELLIEGIEDKQASLVTKMPGVQNLTLSEQDRAMLTSAMEGNKVKFKQYERVKEQLIGVPSKFMEHLELREGNVSSSYNDSLGKLTGGTGHLLTKEEKKLYPLGTKIPEEVTTKWRRQDSKKAYTAATDQASDLGIDKPEFINALASVNFQLGTAWNKKFPTAYKHLKSGNYEDAIQEIVFTKKGSGNKSTWNKQTPVRVQDFVEAIRQL